jgi:hypothetical protein
MKKFILIDQSIKDSGGHHLEYALRVLKAAKKEGFKTVLAVNKLCKDFNSPEIDILEKSFSYGFWENFQHKREIRNKSKKSIIKTLTEKKDDIIYYALFSQLGYAYQVLSQGNTASSVAKRYHLISKDQKIPLWAIVVSGVLLRLRLWQGEITSMLSPVLKYVGKPARLLLGFLKFSGGVLLAPIVLLYLVFKWKNVSARFDRFSALFGSECHYLLTKINANDGDLVFVPTLGDVELTGIGICSQAKVFSGLKWHLLFRRNLFVGRESDYLNQIELIKNTQIALSEFKQVFTYGTNVFYTDTDPLSEQWNLLGIYHFSTLPIPHDDSLKRIQHKVTEPLIISYIGDARDEKGFQHLAQLVGDIRAAGFGSERVKFRFQSNFNVPLGEAGSRIAKAELSLMSGDGVELLEGPFDSNEYTNLINTSDILLVPYDESNYYARSSGVFAEALIAGVPVVYPAKSWMGRELLDENINYSKLLEHQAQPTPWCHLMEKNSKMVRLDVSQTMKNPIVLFFFQLTSTQPGQYVKLSFYEISQSRSAKGENEENLDFCGSILIDLRVACGMCFFRLNNPGIFTFQLEFCDVSNSDQISQNPVSHFSDIRYRLTDVQEALPLQSVGYGYEEIENLSVGVLEILLHYKSYEQRSRAFSKKWGQFHSAKNLIKILSAKEVG